MQPLAEPTVSELPSVLPAEVGGDAPMGAGLDFTDPNSPLAPYYLRVSDVWVVVLLSLLFVLLTVLPLWHSDIWGHLKFGQQSVSMGRLTRSAFCEYEDPRSPFRTVYWLTQAGLYLVYETGVVLLGPDPGRSLQGGVDCLRALHAVLCILRLLVLWLAFRRLTQSPLVALCGLVLALGLALAHIGVFRPQVLAELLFACLLLPLSRPVLSRRALWLIPLTLVVWANCHGSFVIGLCLLGLCLLGRALEVQDFFCLVYPWRALSDLQVRRLFLVLVVSLYLIAMLNPSGPMLYRNTLRMASHYNVQTMDEWKPLAFRPGLATSGSWFYLATLIAVVATQLLSPRRFSAPQILLVLFFGIQPCLHQRMLIWWFMVAPWVVLPHWAAIAQRFRFWPEHWSSIPSFRNTLLVAGIAVMALTWLPPIHWLMGGEPTELKRSLSTGTPWRLAAALTSPGSSDPESLLPPAVLQSYPEGRFVGRIFASESLADYLLWTLPPEQSLLVYSHVHLFPPAHWWDCLLIKFGTVPGKTALDRKGVNLILVEAELHPYLRAWLVQSPDWTVCLDETGLTSKRDHRCRLLLAVRNKPIGASSSVNPEQRR